MAGIHGANDIVTNGLVMCLDAANPRSYSGSGNIWYDLSQNKYVGTLTGTPAYTQDNNGSILFDGSNDRGSIPNLYISSLSGGFTWEGWVTHTNRSAGWGWFLGGSNLNNNQSYAWFQIGKKSSLGGIRFETGGFYSNQSLDADNVDIADGKYHHIIGIVNLNSNTKSIYVDGLLKNSVGITLSNVNQNYGYTTFGFQMRQNTTAQEFWVGRIARISVYNRALSDSEITQNFNALRRRYGI